MRGCEVIDMTEETHILEEGIFTDRSKGSNNEITAWSPRLRKAVDDARRLSNPTAPDRLKDRPLFKGPTGGPIGTSARKSAFTRARKKAMEVGLEIDGEFVKLKELFTYHDIKAKGVTDHENKESGHKSKKMQAVYNRKPDIIKSTR